MGTAAYDAIAQWYDEGIRRGSWLHGAAVATVLELAGEVAGRSVCDLACGQGVVARQLAERGARVVGIDVSERLLEIAREDERARPLAVAYYRDDAQTLAMLADESFDGVVCNLALMDIPDLPAATRAVRRVLRPGGWLAFAITHPCLDAVLGRERIVGDADGAAGRTVRSYFVEGRWWSENRAGVRGQVGAYPRTLSTYLNTLVSAGFSIERLSEPQAPDPGSGETVTHHEVPAILAVRCAKASAGT